MAKINGIFNAGLSLSHLLLRFSFIYPIFQGEGDKMSQCQSLGTEASGSRKERFKKPLVTWHISDAAPPRIRPLPHNHLTPVSSSQSYMIRSGAIILPIDTHTQNTSQSRS